MKNIITTSKTQRLLRNDISKQKETDNFYSSGVSTLKLLFFFSLVHLSLFSSAQQTPNGLWYSGNGNDTVKTNRVLFVGNSAIFKGPIWADSLKSTGPVHVGDSSLILGGSIFGTTEDIYTSYKPLSIQCTQWNNNTYINANNPAKVAVGTQDTSRLKGKLTVAGHIYSFSYGDAKMVQDATYSGNSSKNTVNPAYSEITTTGFGQGAQWSVNATRTGTDNPLSSGGMSYTLGHGTNNTGAGLFRFDGNEKRWSLFATAKPTKADSFATWKKLAEFALDSFVAISPSGTDTSSAVFFISKNGRTSVGSKTALVSKFNVNGTSYLDGDERWAKFWDVAVKMPRGSVIKSEQNLWNKAIGIGMTDWATGAGWYFIVPKDSPAGNPDPYYPMKLLVGGTDLSTVLSLSGSLGLGTDNPRGKLHINNDVTGFDSSLVVYKNGSVGIGTDSVPSAYKMAVNGKIIATEVKILPKQKWPWPDYVFASGYKLKSIGELEAFITENKRLPEMPSAAEVDTAGINMGEMNVKLLQKIEELSLYIIQQNKRIEALEKK